MKKSLGIYLPILFLFVFLDFGSVDSQVVSSNEPIVSNVKEDDLEYSIEENLIHFGDLIEIDVVGSAEYDWRGTLNAEGFLDGIENINSPLFALCRSEKEVGQQATQMFSKFLRNPQVVAKILDKSNRPVSILFGAVKFPHRFQIKRRIRLNELLIISGGLTDESSGEIQVFRPRNLNCLEEAEQTVLNSKEDFEIRDRISPVRVDNGSQFMYIKITELLSGNATANPVILNGDIITVLQSHPIYLIGGVQTPKQVSFRPSITLTRAVTSAGGLSKDAIPAKVTIFRRRGSEFFIVKADLEKIKSGQEKDIDLEAFDIVEIARRGKEEKTVAPVIENLSLELNNKLKLPLRVID